MTQQEKHIKVGIVEDNSELSREIEHAIAFDRKLSCVACCFNAESALKELPPAKPDVVLMDIRLPDGSGIDLVETLQATLPACQFVMLTMYKDSRNILDALSAGAIGYLVKDSSRTQIIEAIHDAYRGESPMSGSVARKVVNNIHLSRKRPRLESNLSARERDVMENVALGMTDKQIAQKLHISLQTVNSHLKKIFSKLGVHSRSEAISRYFMGKNRS